ncbi:uncharacterized protein BDR25DRAFT_358154 [Lindgomyces ingoldianus]|uniref:Uncharacterized protein n=1 Tax=Lindgomyces ingoldianus TaxID=673940 RepID=A0ACB6QLN6_9PLEO|nr:uncharacterized protein BDR25DRAFT_358154 [Lindgomyces ingoldianus]KAF2467889.1 hypothetical protein BDR25DRAFT_358154 [Lindgomyces ingoldianus]
MRENGKIFKFSLSNKAENVVFILSLVSRLESAGNYTKSHGYTHLKLEIIERPAETIWLGSCLAFNGFDGRMFAVFFSYLEHSGTQLRQRDHLFAVGTVSDTPRLVKTLKDSGSQLLSEVLQALFQQFLNVDQKAMRRSLELPSEYGSTLTLIPLPSRWGQRVQMKNRSIGRWNQFISTLATQGVKERSKAEGTFTAAYLVNVCGMNLAWTNHLTDHLILDS